jgi:hypothetical protein
MAASADDLAFRLAATLAIDLMSAQPGLDEEAAIEVAWNAYREAATAGAGTKFQTAQYAEPVRSAIRDIRAGRRKRAENPGVERRARAKLGI